MFPRPWQLGRFETSGAVYVKELVLKNFTGVSAEHLLERMVELSLLRRREAQSW